MARNHHYLLVSVFCFLVFFCFAAVDVLIAERIIAEKRRLEREEEVTEGELLKLQQELNERLARLMRLRRQKKEVVRKGHEMVRKGFKDLDELEAREAEEAAESAQVVEAFAPTDWSSLGLEGVDFSSLLPDGTSVGVAESSEGFR